MTDPEFWREVGVRLRSERLALGYRQPRNFVAEKNLLAPDTIKKIEKGAPGYVSSVSEYAAGLGLSVVDVFSAVLQKAPVKTSADAQAVVRALKLRDVRIPWLASWQRTTVETAKDALARHEQTGPPSGRQTSE